MILMVPEDALGCWQVVELEGRVADAVTLVINQSCQSVMMARAADVCGAKELGVHVFIAQFVSSAP